MHFESVSTFSKGAKGKEMKRGGKKPLQQPNSWNKFAWWLKELNPSDRLEKNRQPHYKYVLGKKNSKLEGL